MSILKKFLLSAACCAVLSPLPALACACGCGVFDVSTGTMLPTGEGGEVWLEYDFLSQSQNRSGLDKAPRADNDDKYIHTDMITAAGKYMFNREWGAEVAVPYWNRDYKTQTDVPTDGATQTFNTSGFGDVRLKGIYTGFSEDMSTGVTFGLKLPTGDFRTPNFDRDTQIGSGSTDLLLGGFHRGVLADDMPLNWFVNLSWDQPMVVQDHYRPGDSVDTAVGIYDTDFGMVEDGMVTPLFQVIGSVHRPDRGLQADSDNTGYTRLLLSPGIEYDINAISLYTDIEVPIYQNINGEQLTAPVAAKFIVGYKF